MKTYRKNILGTGIFILVFCVTLIMGATEGKAASDISYSYDSATKTLTFSGSGRFSRDYELEYKIEEEIYDKGKSIKKIVLKDGFSSVAGYSFDSFYDVEEIVLPDSVKKIGAGAFAYCSELKKVNFTATEVKPYTFYFCRSLETVKFSGKITKIGNCAFSNTGLKDFEMPDSVTEIGEKAFERSDIESIKLSKKLTVIPKHAFDRCTNLETVKIGKKTKTIEEYAFRNCSSLSDIEFGKHLEFIGTKAFYKCSLGEITLPSSLKLLDYAALKDAGITDVTIEPGLEEIGDWAFQKNDMTEIFIPETVTTIQINAFANCRELTAIEVDEENTEYSSVGGMLLSKDGTRLYVCPAGYSGTAYIPSTVTTLNEYSFNKCRKITAFAIGSGTVSGNSAAFSVRDGVLTDSTGTKLIHYPAGLGGEAVIPAGITEIAEYAFEDSIISSVKIPDSVTTIGIAAFIHCENISQVTIPGNVTTLSAACFWGCTALEKVNMESGVENIRRSCFHNCRNLSVVRIPTSVKSIAKTAFYNTSWDMTIYASKQSFALAFAKKNYYKYRVV